MEETLEFQELTLPLGKILGVKRNTIYDDEYYSFDGIPYGQPPVGELRFKAPIPVKPWAGVRDCYEFHTKPVQVNSQTGSVEGAEDCLYLNVYAKTVSIIGLLPMRNGKSNLNSDNPLPVFVWIYGGSFSTGEATKNYYSPDYFMKKDVIVVTINYRLSALGFLSVKDPSLEIPGNAGLKDQVLALKWIKQFIRYFNGDAENITLAGNSAGSASVHYLSASEQSRGLFHKAICMSGTVLSSWALTDPKDYAYRLAKEHGYQGDCKDDKVVEYLRSLEPGKLVEHTIFDDEDRRQGVAIAFAPCLEPYDSDDSIILEKPREMLKHAWGNEIPIIFSGTSDEGLMFYKTFQHNPKLLQVFKHRPAEILPFEIKQNYSPSKNIELAEKLLKVKFKNRDPADATINDLIHHTSIKSFWHGIHRSLLSRLEYSKASTYLYYFSFDSPTFNHLRRKFCGDAVQSGVSHADDISYIWYGDYSWKLDKLSKEYNTIMQMIDLFVNFAKTSNFDALEIHTQDLASNPLFWYPLKTFDPYQALNIGETVKVLTIPEKEEIEVWDTLYKREELF